jgi:hypothetical protein
VYFFGLNTVAALGTLICTVIVAFSAIRTLTNENTPAARIPVRLSAVFGVVGALFALITSFTGYELHALSELRIAALQSEIYRPDLSDSQIETLTHLLTSVPKPTDPVHLTALPNDEAKVLATKIKRALVSAGFTVDGVWEQMALAENSPIIVIRQKAKKGALGAAIAAALKQLGLKSRIQASDALPESRIEIFVNYQA